MGGLPRLLSKDLSGLQSGWVFCFCMMLGWASACPFFLIFGAKKFEKSLDNISYNVYNRTCKGEVSPRTRRKRKWNGRGKIGAMERSR